MENYKEHGHLVYRSSVRRLTLMIGVSVADEHQIEFRTSSGSGARCQLVVVLHLLSRIHSRHSKKIKKRKCSLIREEGQGQIDRGVFSFGTGKMAPQILKSLCELQFKNSLGGVTASRSTRV